MRVTIIITMFGYLLLCGCGGGGGKPPPPPPPGGSSSSSSGGVTPQPPKQTPYPHEKGTASITGKAMFKGTPPRRRPIDTAGHPHCKSDLLTESAIVDKDGNVQNTFVYVSKGMEKYTFDIPKDEPLLDQVGCRYEPHVMGVMVDQKFRIRNGDREFHNVHGISDVNSGFNISQQPGQVNTRKLTELEMGFLIKCDVHPWMSTYVCATDTPFYAVSKQDGTFDIKGLVPGTYTITAWHERFSGLSQEVILSDNETKAVDFTLELDE